MQAVVVHGVVGKIGVESATRARRAASRSAGPGRQFGASGNHRILPGAGEQRQADACPAPRPCRPTSWIAMLVGEVPAPIGTLPPWRPPRRPRPGGPWRHRREARRSFPGQRAAISAPHQVIGRGSRHLGLGVSVHRTVRPRRRAPPPRSARRSPSAAVQLVGFQRLGGGWAPAAAAGAVSGGASARPTPSGPPGGAPHSRKKSTQASAVLGPTRASTRLAACQTDHAVARSRAIGSNSVGHVLHDAHRHHGHAVRSNRQAGGPEIGKLSGPATFGSGNWPAAMTCDRAASTSAAPAWRLGADWLASASAASSGQRGGMGRAGSIADAVKSR